MKKEKREKILIQKLFNDIRKQTIPEYSKIKLRIAKIRNRGGCCLAYYSSEDKENKYPTRIYITINLTNIKLKSKIGYCNDYYEGRHEKLKFVIGNKHKALRFIILHELRHAYQRINNTLKHYDTLNKEIDADDYAVKTLFE